MDFVVSNGKQIVVNTGNIIMDLDTVITITVDSSYEIRFCLVEQEGNTEESFSLDPEEHGVKITLKDFKNPVGSATTKPIIIAKRGEKNISVSFAVYAVGTVRMLHYNILLDE